MGFSYPTMLFVFMCVVAVYSNYVSATIDSYDCTGDEFQCGLSGECIPNLWVCDRIVDCPGREDEIRCCSSDKFNCMSGRCIDFEEVCDGTRDCDQGDDERECTVDACTADEFTCSNSGKCIPKDWKCDFFTDCPDREDELDCCPDDQFTCNNGRCIPLSMVCDGDDECDDGKDELEEHCNYCATEENICHENATCIAVPGSFKCECKDGFNGDGLSCNDTDECSYHTDDCDTNATCTNTQGGYTCECNSGYDGNGTHCLDVDECKTNANHCRRYEHTTCINRPGSFVCECSIGYHGDRFACSDIDECMDNSDSCHHFASCTNTQGSYTCRCDAGYRGDGVSCTDIDECKVGLDNCHHNATCMNQFGDFVCECNHGYRGNGTTCSDIDECADNTHNCDVLGTCVNSEGSYECECHDGLELSDDGFSCQDIDECDKYQPTHNCHVFATCTNTFGLYECECKQGFSGNGFECSDVDECVDFNDCSPYASCTNSIGSYICQCNSGYTGYGKTCELIATVGSLRLVGGKTKYEGTVEIFTASTWSPICDKSWGLLDAVVVCRQLGYPRGFPMAVRGSRFGPGSGQAVMDEVRCSGNEDSLRDCDHETFDLICDANKLAGVICTDHSNVRLADTIETSFNIKGRVQIMQNGNWRNVCHNNWDDLDAKVVCRQLGLPYENARSYSTPISAAQTSEWVAIDYVGCDGDEHDLGKCSHSYARGNCEFASVICSDGLQIDEKPDLFDTEICGTRAGIGGRIVGGQDARPLNWPWAAVLRKDSWNGNGLCAASLINNDWAITAAHCVDDEYEKLTLIFGDTSMENNTYSEHRVERTATPICHPDYLDDKLLGYQNDNDICLLKLDANVTFNKYVRPVCLSVSQEEQTTYGSCYAVGWGKVREDGKRSNELQQLATNLITKSECEKFYPDEISDKMICSATGSEPTTCQGDSGGPLICQSGPNSWHLVGVTSWGRGCGRDGHPDVFTRVSRYTRWIYKIVSAYDSE